MESALIEVFPLGVYADPTGAPRSCARVGDHALDLWEGNLDGFLAAGPVAWQELYDGLPARVTDVDTLIPLADLNLLLPFSVADYVDFYTSEHHATNLGRILRPGQEPLFPNWRHQPIGYHGRSGTVVISGTDVVRPCGNTNIDGVVTRRPTARLDVEVEVGFVVGVGSRLGEPIPIENAADHIFGVVLLNDWSARDIQAWETVPLGPFLGKSFQTSISPWVVPLRALESARIAPRPTGVPPSPLLHESTPWGLDITLELRVNGELVSRPPYREMSWSPPQLLSYLTSNGAAARTGDLLASGTVSGPELDQVGSLIEAWGNDRFLADGDEVVITATAPGGDGDRIDLGAVRGWVLPARD